jgi:hypothetical protein
LRHLVARGYALDDHVRSSLAEHFTESPPPAGAYGAHRFAERLAAADSPAIRPAAREAEPSEAEGTGQAPAEEAGPTLAVAGAGA